MKGNDRAGFTLIELMVTVAILGILAAVALPRYLGYLRAAKERVAKSNFEIAVNVVKSEYIKAAVNNNLASQDIVAELNRTSNGTPYDPSQPAFVFGSATYDGQVSLSVTNLQTVIPNGFVVIQGDWSPNNVWQSDGALTVTKE